MKVFRIECRHPILRCMGVFFVGNFRQVLVFFALIMVFARPPNTKTGMFFSNFKCQEPNAKFLKRNLES